MTLQLCRRDRWARALAVTASLWLALAQPSLASQATLVTPGPPLPMTGLATFLNSALLSIGSCNSGNSAPANGTGAAAFAGECWINTTANPWVFSYTADAVHWSEFGTLNTATFAWVSYSNGFSVGLGGNLSTAGALTQAGAFAATLTFTNTTNATFPAGTHTLTALDVVETWTGAQSFTDGTLILLGASSGSSTLKAPSTGGGTATLFPGTDTIAGVAATQTLTNKTIASTTDTLGGVTMILTGSDATGDTYYRNSAGALTRLPAGSNGQVKELVSGLPAWVTLTISSISGWGTGVATALGDGTNTAGGVVAPSAALTLNGIVYGGGSGSSPGSTAAGTNGQLFLGVTSGAPQWGTMSQDCSITNAGVVTCLKTNNVAFGTLATANPAAPPALGGTTPAAGSFSSLTDTGVSGSTQCIQANSSGALSGTGSGCGSGGSSAWSNTRLAKTSAYTTVSGDCGDTLALGGAAYFPATFDAPSGYTAICAFLVENEDPLAAKLIMPQFATSATSITVGSGSKVFTTASGLTFSSILRYRAYSLANHANFVSGTASYSGTTLTLTVDLTGGSGTFTDWQIAPEIFLWPGQSQLVYNQNNVWLIGDPGKRWKAPVNTTLYLDVINGHDYNDCLASARACLTGNWAVRTIVKDYFDFTGQTNFNPSNLTGVANVVIQLADNETSAGACTSCYTGFHLDFTPVGSEGRASIVIRGNTTTPQNTIISDAVLPASVEAYSGGLNVELDSVQLGQSSCAATPKAAIGASANDHGHIFFIRGVVLGCTTSGQANAGTGGLVQASNGFSIAGGGGWLAEAQDAGSEVNFTGQVITCIGSPAYSNQTVFASRAAAVNLQSVTWTGCGTVTGTRFFVNQASSISTSTGNVNTIPGNAAGSASTTTYGGYD